MQDYTQEDLEKLLEKEKPPFTIYLKAFFLLFVVGGGMFLVNFIARTPETIGSKEPSSQTFESITRLKEEIVPKDTIQQVTKEVQQGGVLAAIDSVAGDIKNEATQAADQVVDKTTDSAVDYIYENTVVKVIEKMIQSLPEDQRTQFVERMCR